jgi:hypothetical protein
VASGQLRARKSGWLAPSRNRPFFVKNLDFRILNFDGKPMAGQDWAAPASIPFNLPTSAIFSTTCCLKPVPPPGKL